MNTGDFILGGTGVQIENNQPKDPEPPNENPPIDTENKEPIGEIKELEEPNEVIDNIPKAVSPIVEEKIITPQEPKIELDEELQKLYNFKKETGLGINEYLETQKDWDAVSDIDIIRKQIKEENSGIKLTDDQLTILAGKKLGIDLSEGTEDLFETDKLVLEIEAAKHRKNLKEIQQKYNTPKETITEPIKSKSQAVSDQVTLSNGIVMEAKEYEQARAKYMTSVTKEVTDFKTETFSMDIGSGDNKDVVSLDYILENDDKTRISKYLEDVPAAVLERHIKQDGSLDLKELTRYALYQDPVIQRKMQSKMISQAYSKGIDSVLKQETNVNFDTRKPDKKTVDKPNIGGRDDVVMVNLGGF